MPSDLTFTRTIAAIVMAMLMVATLIPAGSIAPETEALAEPKAVPWWDDTIMDRDGDRLHDALEVTIEMGAFIEDGRISVLVDFDHTPTQEDENALVEAVDFIPRFRFHAIDIISGTVPVDRVEDILDVPGVVFISFNGPVEAFLDESIPQHGADIVWDLGFTGEGMNIAVIDTGIDPNHMGLDDFDDDPLTYDPKVIGWFDAINGKPDPYDDQGHGSHCAGISAGTGGGSDNNMYRGIAPDAALIGVKVLDSGGSGSFDQVMAGMQWCIDNKEEYNIRAATMSLGGVWLIELTQSQEERLTELANTMVREGIALAIAAGNSGHYGSIGTPGAARDVITVGATNHQRELAPYSSKGPTHEGLIKPNVAGVGGGAGMNGQGVMSVQYNTVNGYVRYSGTSMATPMVAGIMSILLQANPDLDPLTVRSILEYTAEYRWLTDPSRPNNDYGWGFVEADTALEEVVLLVPGLKVAMDPNVPTINLSVNNDTNESYYLVQQNQVLDMVVDGNATYLEWRSTHLSDTGWHRVHGHEGGDVNEFPIDPGLFGLGNHSIWIRAVGPDGKSAPLHVDIHVDGIYEGKKSSEKDDDIDLIPIGIALLVAVAVIVYFTTRKQE